MREWTIGRDSAGSMVVDGVLHPIQTDGVIPVNGYRIELISFTDEIKGIKDSCRFIIPSHQSTRTQHIVGDVEFRDRVIGGSGVFLAVDPEGRVLRMPISQSDSKTEVVYGKGWTITWVAGKGDLEVVQLSTPAFQPEMEEEVKPGDTEVSRTLIPTEYWRKYEALKKKPLYGPASYREQITNIVNRMGSRSKTRRDHPMDNFEAPRETLLSDSQIDRLWGALLPLLDKVDYKGVDAERLMRILEYQFVEAKGFHREIALYRMDILERIFEKRGLISKKQ